MPSDFSLFLSRPNPRLRARRVDEAALAEEARSEAIRTHEWQYLVRHGGPVFRAYKHAALTEAALAVASPDGKVLVWIAKLPANKVTLGGAAEACHKGMRALFDQRFGEDRKAQAQQTLQEKLRERFPQSTYSRLLLQDDEF